MAVVALRVKNRDEECRVEGVCQRILAHPPHGPHKTFDKRKVPGL